MNNSQFQQLKQYLGTELLNYILNLKAISKRSEYEKLEFLPVQIEVLDDLYSKIQQSRIQFIAQGGFGDRVDFYLREITQNGISLFNYYRQLCGGLLAEPTSSDQLIAYLQSICIREYPNLLMKSNVSDGLPWIGVNLGLKGYDEFIRLVKDDVLDNLTNKLDGFDYAFQFSTTDGLEFHSQVSSACNSIITRSFYDSCNRMDYSLDSFLVAVERNIDLLRQLANGQSVTYSSYIGIRGLQYKGFNSIELPGGILRQYHDDSNPGMHTRHTIVGHSGGEAGEYSGHVFEIFHSTKISSLTGSSNTSNSIETNRIQEVELQKLRFAIVFSSLANRGPVPTFFEIGFPLVHPGNYSLSDMHPGNYIVIDELTRNKLIEWYTILNNKDLKKVRTPLKRLQYAIFERRNPEDAIVDAIIAWEGMFSEAFETTFKVTGSMAKFLRSGAQRAELFSRLKKLYNLRSELVHGGTSDLLKTENIGDVRAEVINIGLECVMKIINDDRLLAMSSAERIKSILILDESQNPTMP